MFLSAFPEGFKVPEDQGGLGKGAHVGGFGGNRDKNQDEHKAAVQSSGKTPVILLHGNGGSEDPESRWNLFPIKQKLLDNDYPEELIWALSYLGLQTGDGTADDGGPQASPHTNNVNEVREFIDNVCEYLGVDVVDIIAHSLGCTLAYAVFRGLKQGTPLEFNQPKKWNRVGTFVALAGAFHGLGQLAGGEWKPSPDGAFMKQLLAEDLGGGGETPFGEGKPKTPGPHPHNITYYCGTATLDWIDGLSRGTGKLAGAINGEHSVGFGFEGHENIKNDPAKTFFNEYFSLLNRVPPIPQLAITVDKASGSFSAPLAITVNIDPPNKTVNCVAKRVTKEFRNGTIVATSTDTVEEALNDGETLTLSTDGMWEVVFSAEGAGDIKRIYWLGVPMIEVTIATDNSIPFDRSLVVMATASNSPGAKLFHAVNSTQMWNEGASVTITDNAEIRFIAIDANGIAAEEVSKAFKRRILFQDAVTANVNEHFIARRININEFQAYFQQFGLKPFTLFLVNGRWVLDPNQPIESMLPPTVAASHDSGTHTEPITVTLSAHDEVDPSSRIFFTTDGSTPTTDSPYFIGSGHITLDTSGTKTLTYFAQNSAGNSSDVKTKTYEMKIISGRPVIRVKDGDPQPAEYSGALAITVEAVDDRDEHVTVYYTRDGSIPDGNCHSFRDSKQFEFSEKGNHVIVCYGKDSDGNESYETFYYMIGDLSGESTR
jgi:pimeloyl-ACP methyl ester carboxylesterase